jgi:hypothetical protein
MAATLYQKGNDTSLYLVPGQYGGHVDVKSDFDWTLSRRASRDEVVPCYLYEYQPNNAQLINALYYWGYQITTAVDPFLQSMAKKFQGEKNPIKAAGNVIGEWFDGVKDSLGKMVTSGPNGTANADPLDVYKYRYVARPTGFQYILPFLGDERFGVGNKFQEDTLSNSFKGMSNLVTGQWGAALAGSEGKMANSTIGKIAETNQWINALSFLIEGVTDYKTNFIDTSSWASTDPDSITINFDLINTRSVDQANKNYEFCYLLNYQNHPAQRNAFLAQSPCIYTLFIPNTMYMPVCYMSSFKVMNVGQNRMIDGKAMPEAFRITMTFMGILNPPSRNMLSVLDSGYNNGKIELPGIIDTNAGYQKKVVDKFSKGISNLTGPKEINPTPQQTNGILLQ